MSEKSLEDAIVAIQRNGISLKVILIGENKKREENDKCYTRETLKQNLMILVLNPG